LDPFQVVLSGKRLSCRAAQRLAGIFFPVILLFYLQQAHAEEGGSGHYLPGSIASFMDGVSPTGTFIVRVNILNYDCDAALGRRLPIAGQTALNAEARSTGVGLTFFWRPEWGGIGERWSYAMIERDHSFHRYEGVGRCCNRSWHGKRYR
jgi:hypothetical protein